MDRARMKTLVGHGLTALLVCCVILGLLVVLSNVFHPKNNRYEDGMIDSPANGAVGERQDTIDVLFVGDSEVFSNISPMELWHTHGIPSYVCATGAQQLPYSYTLLRRATRFHKPKYIFFETNSLYAPFTADDLLMRSLQDTFPIFEFHDRWKRLTPRDLTARPRPTWTDDLKGFRINKSIVPADAESLARKKEVTGFLNPVNRAYFEEMIGYCRSIDATPVLFTAPNLTNWSQQRHDAVQKLADQIGVEYLDFNVAPYEVDIDWSCETRDGGDHLNYDGAVKYTHAFGEILTKTYGLADHRPEPAYASWDVAYLRYLQRVEEWKP